MKKKNSFSKEFLDEIFQSLSFLSDFFVASIFLLSREKKWQVVEQLEKGLANWKKVEKHWFGWSWSNAPAKREPAISREAAGLKGELAKDSFPHSISADILSRKTSNHWIGRVPGSVNDSGTGIGRWDFSDCSVFQRKRIVPRKNTMLGKYAILRSNSPLSRDYSYHSWKWGKEKADRSK